MPKFRTVGPSSGGKIVKKNDVPLEVRIVNL